MPGIGGNLYNHAAAMRNNLALSGNGNAKTPHHPPQNNYYPQAPATYNIYSPTKMQGPMPPPLMQDNVMNPSSFNAQSPVSPAFNMQRNQLVNPNLANSLPQTSRALQNAYGGPLFDPSDPALFNFDLAAMNFGNHYGALEFGMLGHMATGAGETPPSDSTTHRGSTGHHSGSVQFSTPVTGTSNFGGSPSHQAPYMFGDTILSEWPNGQAPVAGQINTGNMYNQSILPGHHRASQEVPHAFAIESGPGTFASPSSSSSPQGLMTNLEDSPTTTASAFRHSMSGPTTNNSSRQQNVRDPQPKISTPNLKAANLPTTKKRQRDPSRIYSTVTEPYSYTTGFHSLTAFLQRRFSPSKTLRIAKALASIRPSFIATTKTLNRDDLIFMEKCFQRTLWEYEDFIEKCGTPTIVCRRTGEVAAVGKEFSILTGWRKDILLGKEPNLNVNTGGTSGQPGTGSSSRGGFNTPRIQAGETAVEGRPQPVFLAELLDDESVIEFYEDFARLAFGDSRGSVNTRCKLLKYKTKDDPSAIALKAEDGEEDSIAKSQQQQQPKRSNTMAKRGIAGEAGMEKLGFRDGKVECSYCWTVKRDVFDIPMLIVMNVSFCFPLGCGTIKADLG